MGLLKNQHSFSSTPYDVTIVGGGIVGLGLFRECCLHGIKTLLIDKEDFCSQTSGRSSKMLHGGIRYLEQGELTLVQEALEEKQFWLNQAPHLCHDLPFHLPIYEDGPHSALSMRMGLFLYDFLSHFKQKPYTILSAQETLVRFPLIKAKGLHSAGLYHDAIMDDVKIGLECLYDGIKQTPTNQAMNYVELVDFHHRQDYSSLILYDRQQKTRHQIHSREVVFTAGPFTDRLLKQFTDLSWSDRLHVSKGSHLWIDSKALPLQYPLVQQTKDNRVIFIIPQFKGVLVGTTEIEIKKEDFMETQISQLEIDYLLDEIHQLFPTLKILPQHILSTFSGMRPLVLETGKSKKETSRVHHTYQPFHNVTVIVGGKYTTFRRMAQEVARSLCSRLQLAYHPHKTRQPFLQKSIFSPFEQFTPTTDQLIQCLKEECVKTFDDLIIRRMGISSALHAHNQHLSQDFFIDHLELMKQYIPVTKEEIESFFQKR
jgi:glycerol-3-phosphate dehydrogenase